MHSMSDLNVRIAQLDRGAPDVRYRIGETALAADDALEAGLITPLQWYVVLHRVYSLIPS